MDPNATVAEINAEYGKGLEPRNDDRIAELVDTGFASLQQKTRFAHCKLQQARAPIERQRRHAMSHPTTRQHFEQQATLLREMIEGQRNILARYDRDPEGWGEPHVDGRDAKRRALMVEYMRDLLAIEVIVGRYY